LGETLLKYQNILVPEMNSGQLLLLLRGKFLIDASGLNKVQGKPLGVDEVYDKIIELAGA
jgi:2-oxoglutarate ferredoxin oxidoreductase subunit alpha